MAQGLPLLSGVKFDIRDKTVMNKTYSENIAGLFEIVNYFLLLPIIICCIFWVIPLLIYGGILSFAALFSQKHFIFGVLFFLVYFILFALLIFGFILMIGYFRHSRGKLNSREVDKLWIKTLCYNAIFFFPSFYLNLQCWLTEKCYADSLNQSYNELQILGKLSPVFVLLTFWWGIAVILSLIALFTNKQSAAQQSKK
ncbi:MAG TPA: hypothetical protein VGB00_03250 [Pyrinomonadaceae bacterium]